MLFETGKTVEFVSLLAIWVVALILIYSKREIWVRRLPAIDFVEESVSRAAEMGRPVIVQGFGSGEEGLNSSIAPQILAGLSVLSHVARLCARRGTKILAPQRNQNVIPVADEALRTAFRLEGKSEVYEASKEEMLPWCPTQAALVALGERQRPATNIMVGPFWHESVMLAESYSLLGAVQICGTARIGQMPFFAAVCDMTLIGEEIFAISAYLNQTHAMLASLACADYFKAICIVMILIGTLLATLGSGFVEPLLRIMNM